MQYEIGEIIHESLKHITNAFVVPYRSNCFRSNTPLEIGIPKFITTCIILEANGKIPLAITFVMYFHAQTFGCNRINPPFQEVI